jgi:hypothetical protein
MTTPITPPSPTGPPLYTPPAPIVTPAKFSGLAWSSLILGIIGVVFSAVPIFDVVTMLAAIVGIVLGGIALFGSRKILAASGVALCVLAVVFTALVMNSFSSTVGKAVGPAPSLLPPAAPVEPPTASGPATAIGAGTYVVGSDIVAGTYKTAGPAAGSFGCYWARLKDTSGEFAAIITNGGAQGPTTVTISGSDGAFQTSGCNTWTKVR